MQWFTRFFFAACLAVVSLSACAPKAVVVDSGCKGLSITYDPSQSFLKIGVTATQLHIVGDYHIDGKIPDPATVLSPVALVSLPPIPLNAFMSLYNDEQQTQDDTYNHAGRDFLIGEVGAANEPLFRTGSAVAGIMENTGTNVYMDLWFDARVVNSSHFIGDKDHQITIYLVAAKGKNNNFSCKSIDKFVLSKDDLKVIDE